MSEAIKTQTYTLNTSNTITIAENTTFTAEGTGTINGTIEGSNATFKVLDNANMNISGSKITRTTVSSAWETIELYGNLYMEVGEINSLDANVICTYSGHSSEIFMVGGTISSTATGSPTVANHGQATITGGTITSQNSNAIKNRENATLEISGDSTKISSTATDVPTVYNTGQATITGGTITSQNSNAINNLENATVEISGESTKILSSTSNIYPAVVLDSGVSCKITGGTIQKNGFYAVWVKEGANLDVGNSTDALSTTSPVLIGTHGVYSEGTWNFYNGILKGTTAGYYGEPATLRNGCTMANGTDGNYKTVYLQQ